MRELYEFAVGPMAWVAFLFFIVGSVVRLATMYGLAKKKDGPYLSYMSWKYSLRSILHWIMPFGSLGWRENPAVTVATFVFHICLVLTPIFLLSHIVMWDQYWGVEYIALPDAVADIMTALVIAACVFFAVRRLVQPTLRFVTSAQDWVVLVITALPFVTGFLAYHHVGPALLMTTLHILSGELMLMAIPFTRLSHMLFGLFSRAYIGSEFGGVRRARDW